MTSIQQSNAATNINCVFQTKKLRYAVLRAQCQSGKTGTYHCLIRMMLDNGSIQRAYILCGSNETELRSQGIEDAVTHNSAAVSAGLIKVLFRQDFEANTMDITNTLIIVDESHMDQRKGQQLHKFLQRHGLTMDGNPATLIAKNCFIVSVDATPYSELAALINNETPYDKHIEELIPGPGYIGIGDYKFKGHLQKTFDICKEKSKMTKILQDAGNKYVLMRMSTCKKSTDQIDALQEICTSYGLRIIYYTSSKTEIAITRKQQDALRADGKKVPCLEDAPSVMTLVIIHGRLRAGKVVPKKHIAFVWEGAADSNTDALVQGLLGRMCGYIQDPALSEDPTKLNGDALPMLYICEKALEFHREKVVKASEIDRAIMMPELLPTKATNIKKSRIANVAKDGKTQTPPFRLTFKSDGDEFGEYDAIVSARTDLERARLCRDYFLRNIDVIMTSDLHTAKQIDEIVGYLTTATPHVRNLKGESQLSYFKELHEAYQSGSTPAEHTAGCPPMTFYVLYRGYKGLSLPGVGHERHIYAVFYTVASSELLWVKTAHKKSCIPETNGKSIFSLDIVTAFPLVAAGIVGFSATDVSSPMTFEKAMRNYLSLWLDSPLSVSRLIGCVSERFVFDKTKFNYTDKKHNDVERICAKLGIEFGVIISIKYSRGSNRAAGAEGCHFNVKTISW